MRRLVLLVVLTFGLMPILSARAQEIQPGDLMFGLELPEINVKYDGTEIFVDTPEIASGRYLVIFENASTELITFDIIGLVSGATPEQMLELLAKTGSGKASLEDLDYVFMPGGLGSLAAGLSLAVAMDFDEGTWLITSNVLGAESLSYSWIAMAASGDMPQLEDPAVDVTVTFSDTAITMEGTVPAGVSLWKVANQGIQPHLLYGIQVPEGTTAEAVQASLAAYAAGTALPDNGITLEMIQQGSSTGVLTYGRAFWTEMVFPPGTYAIFCPARDAVDQQIHGASGMVTVFTVA